MPRCISQKQYYVTMHVLKIRDLQYLKLSHLLHLSTTQTRRDTNTPSLCMHVNSFICSLLTTTDKYIPANTQCTQTGIEQLGLGDDGGELHLSENESSIFAHGKNNATVAVNESRGQRQMAIDTHQASTEENEAKNNGQGTQDHESAEVDGFYQMISLRGGEVGEYSRYLCSSQSASMDFSSSQLRYAAPKEVNVGMRVTSNEEASILSHQKTKLVHELDQIISERLHTVRCIEHSTVSATRRLDKVRELLRVEEKFVRNGQSQLKIRLKEMLQHESRIQKEVEERRRTAGCSIELIAHIASAEYSLPDTASRIAEEDSVMTFEEDSLCAI